MRMLSSSPAYNTLFCRNMIIGLKSDVLGRQRLELTEGNQGKLIDVLIHKLGCELMAWDVCDRPL